METFDLAAACEIVPPDLEELLVMEAYLRVHGEHLTLLEPEMAQKREEVESTRPPFAFLKPTARDEFERREREFLRELEEFETEKDLNLRLTRHLKLRMLHQLERWLRLECEDYKLGLASENYVADWQLALNQFEAIAREFVQRLGVARNTLVVGYDRDDFRLSDQAEEQLSAARICATRVEAEIVNTNRIAHKHDRLLQGTLFADPMPRLVLEPYVETVVGAGRLEPGRAQKEFDRLKHAMEDLIERELAALRERANRAAALNQTRKHSYVLNAWRELHAFAYANSVNPQHVEAALTEIAKVLQRELELPLPPDVTANVETWAAHADAQAAVVLAIPEGM